MKKETLEGIGIIMLLFCFSVLIAFMTKPFWEDNIMNVFYIITFTSISTFVIFFYMFSTMNKFEEEIKV